MYVMPRRGVSVGSAHAVAAARPAVLPKRPSMMACGEALCCQPTNDTRTVRGGGGHVLVVVVGGGRCAAFMPAPVGGPGKEAMGTANPTGRVGGVASGGSCHGA